MSNSEERQNKLLIVESPESTEIKEEEPGTSCMSGDRPQKRAGRRPGRRSSKMDVRAKLERSRQSARECRARKKLRYQYLEDLVANREKAVFALRDELEMYKQWCIRIDSGLMPMALLQITENVDELKAKKQRLEKISEEDEDVPGITSQMSQHHMGTEQFKGTNSSDSVCMKGDNQSNNKYDYYDSEQIKGTNSSASVYRKGDNQSNGYCSALPVGGASGSTEMDGQWNMMQDEHVLIVDPRTEHLNHVSLFKIDKQALPTILEESEIETV